MSVDSVFGVYLRDDTATGLLGCPRAKVTDNICIGGKIVIEDSDRAQVNDNYIYEAANYGIQVDGDYIAVLDNVIIDGNTDDGANVSGILVNGNYPQVYGNHIENVAGGNGHLKYGITCTSCDRPTLRDNLINNMETTSYYLTGVTNIIATLANEATPSVIDTMGSEGRFLTGGVTTITDLDDTYPGQIIIILCKHSLTFDFTTAQDADHNLDGSSADITADAGDILTFLSEDGTTIHLISNLDASVDNN